MHAFFRLNSIRMFVFFDNNCRFEKDLLFLVRENYEIIFSLYNKADWRVLIFKYKGKFKLDYIYFIWNTIQRPKTTTLQLAEVSKSLWIFQSFVEDFKNYLSAWIFNTWILIWWFWKWIKEFTMEYILLNWTI